MADWDQDYERSEDDPEDVEAFTVLGQFRVDFDDMSEWSTFDAERDAPNAKHWHTGDCIGGCAGYDNVLSPFENPYVIDIMAQTIDAFREEWKHYLSAKADRSHGRCPHCHGTGRSYFQG
jgi:hypothetical protein